MSKDAAMPRRQELLRASRVEVSELREQLRNAFLFAQRLDFAFREAGHPTTAAALGSDGDERVSHVECVRALAAERDELREKVTLYETASWADAVQGEAAWRGRAKVAELALGRARELLKAKNAKIEELQTHVSVVDSIARRTLRRMGHVSDVPTPATNCMGALEADIERERTRVRKVRGHVAAMREVLQEIKKITFPDESSNVYHETAYHLAANAVDNKFGEPEAEVLVLAEQAAKHHQAYLGARTKNLVTAFVVERRDQVLKNLIKAVERMLTARAKGSASR